MSGVCKRDDEAFVDIGKQFGEVVEPLRSGLEVLRVTVEEAKSCAMICWARLEAAQTQQPEERGLDYADLVPPRVSGRLRTRPFTTCGRSDASCLRARAEAMMTTCAGGAHRRETRWGRPSCQPQLVEASLACSLGRRSLCGVGTVLPPCPES